MSVRRPPRASSRIVLASLVVVALSSSAQVPEQANDLTAVWPAPGAALPVNASVFIETTGLLAQAHVVDRPDVVATVEEVMSGATGIRLFDISLSGVSPGERVDLAIVTTATTTTIPLTIAPPFEGPLAEVPTHISVRPTTPQDDVVAEAPVVHVVTVSTQAVDDPNVALVVVERSGRDFDPEIVTMRVPRGDAPVTFFVEGSGNMCARLGLVDGRRGGAVYGPAACVDLPEDTGCSATPPGAPLALLVLLAARRRRPS